MWLIFWSCAQDGLVIDVSRSTTLSVETIAEEVSRIRVSTLERGARFESVIVEDQTAVIAISNALNVPFEFPLSADLITELEDALTEYVQDLSEGRLRFGPFYV